MTQRMNRQIRLIARPKGPVKDSDFKFTEEPVRELNEGEILIKTLYFALDPAQRNWMDDDPNSYLPPIELGAVVPAVCLGKIVESRHPDFSKGAVIWSWSMEGWQQYQIADMADPERLSGLRVLKPDPEIPLSYYLSGCGVTSLTAYFGLTKIGKPRIGETVLISGAAGAVGSIAGQIAKNILGCRVVGIDVGKEKCDYLVQTLGFDQAIDAHQSPDMIAAIKNACPQGVDVFFDNIGGEILDAALMTLNFRARILMCGRLAAYEKDYKKIPGPHNMWQLVVKNARIEGFLTHPYLDEYEGATRLIETWTKSGLLTFREHVVDGLHNTLDAFRSIYTGTSKGRLMVKLADVTDPAD
jgi:NADPH-dependent curcumin reductase CurA